MKTIEQLLSAHATLERKLIEQRIAIRLRLTTNFVSPKQAAFELGITVPGVHHRINNGTLRAVTFEGRKYINESFIRSSCIK